MWSPGPWWPVWCRRQTLSPQPRSIPYTQNEDGSFKKIHIPVEGGYASVLSDGNVVNTFDPATLKDPTKDTDVYYIVYYSLVGQKTANLSNQPQSIELDNFYSVSTSGDEMWPATFGPITLTNNLNQIFDRNTSIWVEGNYIQVQVPQPGAVEAQDTSVLGNYVRGFFSKKSF